MAPKVQVRLEGDASGLVAASAQGGRALDGVAGRATQTGAAAARNMTPAINAARGAMASLATQALGVPGPLGVVIAQFGSLGAGSAVMAGALGGLALLATAWRLITKETREAGEAQQKAIAALVEGNRVAGLGPAGEVPGQIGKARAALIPLRAREESITRLQRVGLAGTGAPEQLAKVRQEIADLLEVIRRGKIRAEKLIADAAAEALDTPALKAARAAAEKAAANAAALTSSAADFMADLARATENAAVAAAEVALAMDRHLGLLRGSVPTGIGAPSIPFQSQAGSALRSGPGGMKGMFPTLPFGETLTPSLALAKEEGVGMLGKAASMAGNALKSFGPAALAVAALFEVLKGVMEPLQPILDVVSGLLQSIGNVIGTLLAPVLRLVAKIFSYVIQAVGIFVEALGKFVDKIVPDWISKAGKSLALSGQQMQDDAKASREMLGREAVYDNLADHAGAAAEAMADVASSMSGFPSWFKAEGYRFRAASPQATSGAGAGGGSSTTIGTVNVTLAPPAGADGATMLRMLTTEVKRVRAAGGIVELDLAPV